MAKREQWGSRAGFIMAAVGSAIGLGNIWRFPYTAYSNGGGAFFIPYLFALLTAGIPILILEFTMGHKLRGSAPLAFFKIKKGAEFIGWWQALVAFIISCYYSVIIAWAIDYTFYSFTLSWGKQPDKFFGGPFLNAVGAGHTGHLVSHILFPLIVVWVITLAVLFKGVKKGIEKANKFFIPTLVVLFLIIVVRAVTLPGALEGLNVLFQPDWSKIWSGDVWVAAYGQIFFSLSVGFAIMIAYSSYLPKKSDIVNNAFVTAFSNSGFELLAGIGVFAALGAMAHEAGVSVTDVASGGVGLAFITFPKVINSFPFANQFFGVLFFLSLVFAGMSSLISIVEAYISAVIDKFNIPRSRAVTLGGGLAAIISLLFATQGGLNFLDVIDHYINSYGIALAGLFEVILVAWVARKLNDYQQYANEISDIRAGLWWKLCLSVITPLVLGWMMIKSIIGDLTHVYGGGSYSVSFNFWFGWLVALLALGFGFVFALGKWKENVIGIEKGETLHE